VEHVLERRRDHSGRGRGLCLVYLIWSLYKGKVAPANPWGAKGLEWEKTQSPPSTFNFEEDVIVTEPAYNYASNATVHHE
jgi:cytochrome c oxidase subunit 1